MKRLNGFSLMEMMVVLLITAIVAAATAPMVSRKIISSNGSDSPFLWANRNLDIVYNVGNAERTVNIGGMAPNGHPRMYIRTNDPAVNPQITFATGNVTTGSIIADTENRLGIGNGIALGGNNNLAIGNSSSATGTGSTAIGQGARAITNESISVGHNARANTFAQTIAIGNQARATGNSSVAVGGVYNITPATASGNISVAMGVGAEATQNWNTAIGGIAKANSGNTATALGYNAKALGYSSIGIGCQFDNQGAIGSQSTAIGRSSTASGERAIAIGTVVADVDSTNATAQDSIAIGSASQATGNNSVAIGSSITYKYCPTCSYKAPSIPGDCPVCGTPHGSMVSGSGKTRATQTGTTAIGTCATATGSNATAVGYLSNAEKTEATAFGNNANANSKYSVAIGGFANTQKDYAIAIGYKANAKHANSTAIGVDAKTYADNTITLGTTSTTVYIPGNLVVGKYATLGLQDHYMTRIRLGDAYGSGSSTYDYNLTGLTGQGGSGNNNHGSYIYHDWDFNAGRPDYYPGHKEDELKTYLTNYSDKRLKNIGKAFTPGLEQIKKLEVFNYTFKDDKAKTPRVGVIAQDLQKIFPDAVTKGEDGYLKIRWEDMFYAMVNAIKELDNKIFNHETRIQNLEKQNKELQTRLDKLEKRLEKLEGAKK